jgi:hypothetical protein
MAISIHFQGGPKAGQTQTFGDDVESIVIGRDPHKCQVVFPPDETKVGREHCALRRELARYRLVLNRDDLVLLDGKAAIDGQELAPTADLQLGPGGPKLVVETTQRGDLPATARKGHQRGHATLLRDSKRSARRTTWIAFSATALVLAVGVLSYHWRGELLPVVVKLGEGQEKIRHQQDTQSSMLHDLADRLAEADRTAKANKQGLPEALNKAAASVYLVLERDSQGDVDPQATAWVVNRERGILATNGHVADIFNQIVQQRPNHQLIVRSTADPPVDCVVTSVKIHPGYAASNDLWSNFQPTRRTSEESDIRIDQPGPFCDVALMFVDAPDKLAEALPLADDDTLKKLAAGYPLGAVGFPMEGLSLHGVNVEQPAPTTHLAYITAVTNYFGAGKVDFAEKLLVQHAIPTAGGASGSPLINADGKVVAVHNAGNVIGQTDEARITSGALINFAQRVDLVGELLDDRADEAQAQRTQQWRQEISRYYSDITTVERGIHDVKVAELRSQWERKLAADATVEKVDELISQPGQLTDQGAQGKTFQGSQTFDVPQGGKLLVVVAGDANDAVDLTLYSVVDGGRKNSWPASTFENNPWLQYCFITLAAGGRFEANVSGTQQNAGYVLHALLAQLGASTPDTRRETLVANWFNSHVSWQAQKYHAEQLVKKTVTLAATGGPANAFRATAPVSIPAGDDYFVVARAQGGEHITLSVLRGAAELLGEDRSDTDLPSVACTVPTKCDLQIAVTGPRAGVVVDIFVYHAVAATN